MFDSSTSLKDWEVTTAMIPCFQLDIHTISGRSKLAFQLLRDTCHHERRNGVKSGEVITFDKRKEDVPGCS